MLQKKEWNQQKGKNLSCEGDLFHFFPYFYLSSFPILIFSTVLTLVWQIGWYDRRELILWMDGFRMYVGRKEEAGWIRRKSLHCLANMPIKGNQLEIKAQNDIMLLCM